MPIFEYRCKKCKTVFEVLVRASTKPECPNCKSKRLEKLISTFNATAEKPSSRRRKLQACQGQCCGSNQHGGCGGCCGGCGCG